MAMDSGNNNVMMFDIYNSYGVSPMETKDTITESCVEKAVNIATEMIAERKKLHEEKLKDTKEYNNLIVFTGDRGSGKSTVMRTFIDRIVEKKNGESKNISKELIYALPVIDPTMAAEDEKLVGEVVSYIFTEIKNKTLDPRSNYEIEKTRKVYECCAEAHSALRVIYTGAKDLVKDEADSLESLDKLASSAFLQERLDKLFKAFSEWSGHGTLLIPIDDVDMKVSGNYKFLEEIRNYLFNPYVIVVMSVKLEQLTDSLEQHFKREIKDLLLSQGAIDSQPAEMASKYLLKLIPAPRRVALPILRSEAIQDYFVQLPPSGSEKVKLVDEFMKLIYQKTGIILVKDKSHSHGLIPTNLRALRHVFDMLHKLKNVFESDENYKYFNSENNQNENSINLEHNLNRIEEWVLDSAYSNVVPRGLARIANNFAVRPTVGIHAFLVKELDDYFKESISHKGLFGEDLTIKAMLAHDALPENISMGDALYAINLLERHYPSEEIGHFVAIIKMLYSIRMTRATHLYWLRYGHDGSHSEHYRGFKTLINGLVYNQNLRLLYTEKGVGSNREVNCTTISRLLDPGMAVYEDLNHMFLEEDTKNEAREIEKETYRAICEKVSYSIKNIETDKLDDETIKNTIIELFNDECNGNLNEKIKKRLENAQYLQELKVRIEKGGRLKATAWRLLFFLGVGRIKHRDIHTIRRTRVTERQSVPYAMTRLRVMEDEGTPLFAQFNFLAVINNWLCPVSDFVERVAYVFPEEMQEELKKALNPEIIEDKNNMQERSKPNGEKEVKDIEDTEIVKNLNKICNWERTGMFNMFALSCVDVLDSVILHMNRHADLRKTIRKNEIFKRGAVDFNDALEEALKEVYKNTAIKKNISLSECGPFCKKVVGDSKKEGMFKSDDFIAVWDMPDA